MSDWHWVKSTLPRLISSRRYDTIYLNADNLLQSRRRVELKLLSTLTTARAGSRQCAGRRMRA